MQLTVICNPKIHTNTCSCNKLEHLCQHRGKHLAVYETKCIWTINAINQNQNSLPIKCTCTQMQAIFIVVPVHLTDKRRGIRLIVAQKPPLFIFSQYLMKRALHYYLISR